jgi:nucleoside-diphosphate-sugar epimerase
MLGRIPPVAVLITGVGYIGSALLTRLCERGERVVGLDNFYCTPRGALATLAETPGFTLLEGDVAEARDVAHAFDCAAGDGPLTVYHLAAQPSAAVAARDPDYTERTNLVGARLVLEAARDRRARVVFGGSFRVYGDDLVGRLVDEENPYGRVGDLSHLSKLYVEQLGRMLGVPFISVRLGVVYGQALVMKLVPQFMTVPHVFCQKAAHGEVLHVLQDRPVAFIHVADAARALVAAADLLDGALWQVVNAAPEVMTIGEVASTVQRLLRDRNRSVRIEGAMSEPGSFTVGSRLEAAGFRPQHQMQDSLGAVLDYFLERVR